MERFHLIDDAAAILVSKGVYKQVKVFRRGNDLFAAHGGGYIRLYTNGTSISSIRLDALDIGDMKTTADPFGKLSLAV